MLTHTEQFTVRRTELGTDFRVRAQAVCNYMEEAAGNHAAALGVGVEHLAADGLAWVLAKMRILFQRFPEAGERLSLETWPVSIERLQFRRDFSLCDAKGEEIITAVTQWVVLGIASRRIERIPQNIAHLRPENPRYAVADGDIRIPAIPDDPTRHAGPAFPIRLADIDQNQHVNNVRYVDFALEAAYSSGSAGPLRQLDLIFRAEGLRGDIIASATDRENGTPHSLIHSFYRQGTGQELARARTVWGEA